jgi:hypothetical protein
MDKRAIHRAATKAFRQALTSGYRRLKIEGGTFFCALALADRDSNFLVRHIECLRHTIPASHPSLNHLLPLCSAYRSSATLLFDRQTSAARSLSSGRALRGAVGVFARPTLATNCAEQINAPEIV